MSKETKELLRKQKELGLLPPFIIKEKSLSKTIQKTTTAKASRHEGKQEMNPLSKLKTIDELRQKLENCKLCRLHQERTQIVFGEGNPKAKLMFIGEGPGRDEDLQGRPFVGRAGQLLTKIIEAMGLKREEVYIANIVKSRPPENRRPADDEIETCLPFLIKQIEIIHPKIIVCLGNTPVQTLVASQEGITQLRGKIQKWPNAIQKEKLGLNLKENSILLMPTYHPAYLLRNPNMKKPVWEDMQIVMEELKK